MDTEVLRSCFSLPPVNAVDSLRAIIDIRLQQPRICPACITAQPHIKEHWQLAHHTHCIEHSITLIDRCPSCAQPLKWSADLFDGCTNPDCTFQWDRCSVIPQSLPLYQQAESYFTESENTEYLRKLYQKTSGKFYS